MNTHGGPNRGQGRKPGTAEKTLSVNFRITPDMKRRLETSSRLCGMTQTAFIETAINEYSNKVITQKVVIDAIRKRPLLYTDTIEGKQVCRDDMWAVTTAEIKDLESGGG